MVFGHCPEQFSRLTLRLISLTLDADRRRLRREQNERAHLAWMFVKITSERKPLKHYLVPIDEADNDQPAWMLQRAVEQRALTMSRRKRKA